LKSTDLPDDFDEATYFHLHPDVARSGMGAAAHWNTFGRQEGRRYKLDGQYGILLFTKNEGPILQAWIRHHVSLVKPQSIYIFDNGSSDPFTCQVLDEAQALGCNVDLRFKLKEHFEGKGSIMISKMAELDLLGGFDFYFMLDTDELLACDVAGSIAVDGISIRQALAKLPVKGSPYMVSKAILGHPSLAGHFRPIEIQKTFFASKTAATLDIGYHVGTSKNGLPPINTSFVFLDFHFMSFMETKKRALEKLAHRVDISDQSALSNLVLTRGKGFHLVQELEMDASEYAARFSPQFYTLEAEVLKNLEKSGTLEALAQVMDYR
jgi:hypothetical protein